MATVVAAFPPPTPVEPCGFRRLDELTRDPASRGIHFAHGPRAALDAAAAHVARRARALGRTLLEAGRFEASCAWRELAVLAGAASADPAAAAQEILAAAGAGLILVHERAPTGWGRAVAEEIACITASAASPVLVVVCSDAGQRPWAGAILLDGALGAEELRAWWEAAALDAERGIGARLGRLDALEGWWSAAMATPAGQRPAAPPVSAAAQALLDRVILSRRPWRQEQLRRLGPSVDIRGSGSPDRPQDARDELLACGLLRVDERGWITPSSPDAEPAAQSAGDVLAAAEALDGLPVEPWAWARASELFASIGLADRAEDAASRAILGVGDVTARADFCHRWRQAIDALPGESSGARLLRASDLALKAGDVEGALELARAAVARGGESFWALIALGRAACARGDLTTAGILLGKALGRGADAAERARAAVELAEVRYRAGDRAEARRLAEEALAGAPEPSTRLDARNTLGKLHLASGAWAQAEEHFASDAWEAACAGDAGAELRARLNRAIALLSMDQLDEARSILLGVLADGEEQRDPRATGLALFNLSVIAVLRHEHLSALHLSERAVDVFRGLGEKASLAHFITSLAELRLRMGLIAEAEQALAFGRKVCGAGSPGLWASHLALVAAQIHLARGRTVEATAEVSSAIASATRASSGAKLGDCCVVAARIALEDGDLPRAERMIERARAESSSARVLAEIAQLEALLARAQGAPFAGAAAQALALAREAGDEERQREAHALLHAAARDGGDAMAARHHLDAALSIRDRMASALPEEMRRRFLAQPALAELTRLEALAAGARREAEAMTRGCEVCGDPGCAGCSCPKDPGEPSRRAPAAGAAPAMVRLVGSDPGFRALCARTQKVGASDATVLIQGESGTGKELVAEALHEASPRRAGPMIKVNCAALVETLLLSELFGHERGSFTGAAARRRGRFELAEGGTLFLDEIGDISPRTQVALLRVLQDRTFERVGGVTSLRANVRIVCATHRDLRAMVARGEFREDLYYRLRQVVLEVPALRQRLGDLPEIAASILGRLAAEWGTPPRRLSARALAGLARHPWPGNIRELENALRAAALFAEGDEIDAEHFASNVDSLAWMAQAQVEEPSVPQAAGSSPRPRPSSSGPGFDAPPSSCPDAAARPSDPGFWFDDARVATPEEVAYAHVRAGTSLSDMKREIERACIARALEESRGNITRAAALLGMKRPRLSQLVKQYGFGGVSEDG